MFQLIVVILGIALVALLALASIFWGAEAFTEGTARASYAQNINSAAQIEGAMQLYYQDFARNSPKQDMELLQELYSMKYLKDIPIGDWKVQPGSLYKPIEVQSVDNCRIMNRVAGYEISTVPTQYDGCPPCNGAAGTQQLTDAETFKGWPGCQFIP